MVFAKQLLGDWQTSRVAEGRVARWGRITTYHNYHIYRINWKRNLWTLRNGRRSLRRTLGLGNRLLRSRWPRVQSMRQWLFDPQWAERYGRMGEPRHPSDGSPKTDARSSAHRRQSEPLGPLTRTLELLRFIYRWPARSSEM